MIEISGFFLFIYARASINSVKRVVLATRTLVYSNNPHTPIKQLKTNMSAKRRQVVSEETQDVYVEQYLGRDPTSIVMQYVGIEVSPNTDVFITLFSESKDMDLYDSLSRLPSYGSDEICAKLNIITSVLKNYIKICNNPNMTTLLPENAVQWKLFILRHYLNLEDILQNILSRLCEATRTNDLRFKVQVGKQLYQLQPWRIHPPIPDPFPELNNTTLPPPPATLINWLLRLLVPCDKPRFLVCFFIDIRNSSREAIIRSLSQHLQLDRIRCPTELIEEVLLNKYPRQVLLDAGCFIDVEQT